MSRKFPITKKGYDPSAVNTYIAELEEVIRSYKEKDIAIKNALVNAQIAADNIVKNAEIEADTYKLKAIEKMVNIKNSVKEQREYLSNFQNDYNRLVQKYLKDFNSYDLASVDSKIDELYDFITDVINDKGMPNIQETKVVKAVKNEYKERSSKSKYVSIKNNSAKAYVFEEETPDISINLNDNDESSLNKSIASYLHTTDT